MSKHIYSWGYLPYLHCGSPLINLILHRHINRSVPEIEQLQHERRKGRPPSKREEALVQRTEAENKELKTGFWMPDLSDEGVIKTLPRWNRDWSALSMMKFIRFTADGGKQPSAFPPKGLSWSLLPSFCFLCFAPNCSVFTLIPGWWWYGQGIWSR